MCLQHVREKVVVAVPVTAVVERNQEQVGAVQRLQGGPSAGLTSHGIAKRAAQPVQQAGPQQEGPDLLCLTLQNLLDQVVHDVPVIAREPGDETGDVVTSLHGERGQLERSDPAFGASLQCGDVCRCEAQPNDVVEIGRHFVGSEAQVGGADLDQLAAGPQPSQWQEGVSSAADHQVDVRGKVLQEEHHAGPDIRPVDQVVVCLLYTSPSPR